MRVGKLAHSVAALYRKMQAGMVEIVRVLHDRMEPSGHVARELE